MEKVKTRKNVKNYVVRENISNKLSTLSFRRSQSSSESNILEPTTLVVRPGSTLQRLYAGKYDNKSDPYITVSQMVRLNLYIIRSAYNDVIWQDALQEGNTCFAS